MILMKTFGESGCLHNAWKIAARESQVTEEFDPFS